MRVKVLRSKEKGVKIGLRRKIEGEIYLFITTHFQFPVDYARKSHII